MGVIWAYEYGWYRMMIHPLLRHQQRCTIFPRAYKTPIGPSNLFPMTQSVSKKQQKKEKQSGTQRFTISGKMVSKKVSPEGSKQAISALFGGDLCS